MFELKCRKLCVLVGCLGGILVVLLPRAAKAGAVDSTFIVGSGGGNYNNAANWSPAQVPNNSGSTLYNVTIAAGDLEANKRATLDIDVTISNLSLSGTNGAGIGNNNPDGGSTDHNLTVTGTTTNDVLDARLGYPEGIAVSADNKDTTFDLGTLTNFSGTTLTGGFYGVRDLSGQGQHLATVRFAGANIVTLSGASIYLAGPGSRITDEQGNDALHNLAVIDGGSSLTIDTRDFTTAGDLANDGDISLVGPATFTIKGSLASFDLATRTLTARGRIFLDESENGAAILRFNGADIVNNATNLTLGPNSQILDENGNNGLRHFAHNMENAGFQLFGASFTTDGNFTNDGFVYVFVANASSPQTLQISGTLTNFDPVSRTLGGTGNYTVQGQAGVMATLQFNGADIVNNAVNLTIFGAAAILDEKGNNGLRNFSQNMSGARFELENSSLTVSNDFVNLGDMTISGPQTSFTVVGGHKYSESGADARMAVDGGTLTAGAVSIQDGFLGVYNGTVNGDVAIIRAALFPVGTAAINGNLALSSHSHLHFSVGGTTQGSTYDYIPVSGIVTLGGDLDVALNFTPANTDTFTVLASSSPITGRFDNVVSGGRLNTTGMDGSFIVNYSGNNLTLSGFQAGALPAGNLLNIATRMRVQAGDNVLIGGFIITGTDPKKVIIRGIGPSLAQFFNGALADPTLELYQGNTLLEMNDDWKARSDGSSQQADVEATGIPPSSDLEAAIVRTLAPGAYTAIVRGKGGTAGIGVVEAYDLNQVANSKFGNIATRGFVDTDDNVMIGGLIVGPASGASAKVIVRALGPSLSNFGVAGALANPTLDLVNTSGTVIGSNDEWKETQQTEIENTGLEPSDDHESALINTLAPGNYTAIVRGKGNTTGVGLVEAYNLQ
jgi:hypothetical protein